MTYRRVSQQFTQFTHGPSDSSPRFAPDGRQIAFLRPDVKGRPQLWLIPLSGGEARQLTRAPGGVTDFAWSPGSQAIAFVSEVDPDRLPDDHNSTKEPRVRVVRRIRYRADTLGWLGDAHRHLFVVDTAEGETRQLTFGDGEAMGPVWSPDGGRIAFVSDNRADRDLVPYADAYVVPAEGGAPEHWSQGLVSVVRVEWSPDGKRLAAIGSQDPQLLPGWQGWVFILEPGVSPRRLTDDSVNPAGGFVPVTWPPPFCWNQRDEIVFIGDRHGQSYLCATPASGGELRMLGGGGAQFTGVAFDDRGDRAAVAAGSPYSPGELRLINLVDGSHRQIAEHNEAYLREHPPARQEKFVFTRAGLRHRVPVVPAARLGTVAQVSAGPGHPRRTARRVHGRLQ